MSGRPIDCPALSLQEFMTLTSCRNSAVVPTVAIESPQAVATAFAASVGLSFASPSFTTTLRHANPPWEFM